MKIKKAIRTYSEVGKEYSKKEIDVAISETNWADFRKTNLPLCQGECLKTVIRECNIPLSKISKMDIYNVIKNTHGFYALDVQYKNGQAQIYIADNGCSACVVASDFLENN